MFFLFIFFFILSKAELERRQTLQNWLLIDWESAVLGREKFIEVVFKANPFGARWIMKKTSMAKRKVANDLHRITVRSDSIFLLGRIFDFGSLCRLQPISNSTDKTLPFNHVRFFSAMRHNYTCSMSEIYKGKPHSANGFFFQFEYSFTHWMYAQGMHLYLEKYLKRCV